MSTTGGGQQSIEDLVVQLGDDAVLREVDRAGLDYSERERRFRCPFPGICQDKGAPRRRNVQFYPGRRHPRFHCFGCETTGDIVDLVQATHHISRDEALAHLRGQPVVVRAAPQLRVVAPPLEVEDPEKLKPAEVKNLWDSLARSDQEAEQYLEGRGLAESVELGLVRFASPKHSDRRVAAHARRGYRIAMLLTDVVGEPRGIQMRAVGKPKGDSSWMSVRGSAPGRAFYGAAGAIEASPIICITEGGADTLAVSLWTAGRSGIAVVGAAGIGNLPKIAKELEAAGIPLADKVFLLFTQNDAPENKSRRYFEQLRQLLVARGARAAHVATHPEYKDIALWLEKQADLEWPPPEAARLFQFAEEDGPAKQQADTQHAALIPDQVKTDRFGNNFTTLCALLDDPGHREGVFGRRGDLTFCEMTHLVRVGGRVVEETDLSAVRLGLEGHTSPEGKPLKFKEEEIGRALKLLGRRKTVHPVRDFLEGLRWDGVPRMDIEFPAALGYGESAFACTLLSRWLISVVARPMRPGCKVDTVLVLVGPQAAGKSTFCNAIAGNDDWFTDSPVNVGDTNGKMLMRKVWIVEWAELDAMRRARDQEATKAFLSARIDHFREPYARNVIEAPRHSVIVGTTNNSEFLHDPTGNRRFWPVEVKRIDLAWIRANREQLLAEAVARFRAGEQWWLTAEEELQLAEVHQEHKAQHPWAELISDWLDSKGAFFEVGATQVLIEAVHKPDHQITPADEQAVGRVMRELGWARVRRSLGGRLRWVYARPE